MAADQYEKKLDRYYDDIMSKLLESIEGQKVLLGEQKELKKDVAKLKEHVLEIKTTLDRLDTRTESWGTAGVGFKKQPENTAPSQSKPSAMPKGFTLEGSGGQSPNPVQPKAPAAPAPGTTPNLKEFLSSQLAIFDVKVLNAFIKATKEIVKSNSRVEPAFIKPIIENKVILPIIVAGKMNLSRDKGDSLMAGSMALCFDQRSAVSITKAVFMLPEDAAVTDSDIRDVASEICNQICGKSKLTLKSEGYSFEIGMPDIHQGSPAELNSLLGTPKIVLQFDFAKVPFYIYFWG